MNNLRKISLLILLSGCALVSFAQNAENASEKKFNHYVGVQINELIRQVFNFNNSTSSTAVNPYLLTYSFNHTKTGLGGRLGIGYSYRSFTDDNGVNLRTSDINDMALRVGVEKAFTLSEKWNVGIGADFLYNLDKDLTRSTITSFDTTVTITDTRVSSIGGGAMGWLRYSFSPRLSIGTEASFYYVTGNQKSDMTITRKSFGQQQWTTTATKTSNDISEGVFRLPVAIYLLVRF